MISLLFWVLAAVCVAIMDTLKHHYTKSIFYKDEPKHRQWWNPDFSWRNKYENRDVSYGRNNKWIVLTDAWHFFKALMILFTILTTVTFDKYYLFGFWWMIFPIFLIYLVIYWGIFELFYKYILIK
jgi:hypothetical protein